MVDIAAIHARSRAAIASWDRRATKKAASAGQPKQKRSTARSCLTEDQEQIAFFKWAWHPAILAKYPELARAFHIPNGGFRNAITGARLKFLGVRRGVPDICLPVARSGKHSLWIEMKAKDGRLTVEQKSEIDQLRADGYGAAVCLGWEQARDVVVKYLAG